MYISTCITIYLIYLKNSTCSVFSLKSSILQCYIMYITFLYITFFYHHLYSFPKKKLVSLRWHVLISLYDAVDACGWRIDISVHSSSPFIANRRLKLLCRADTADTYFTTGKAGRWVSSRSNIRHSAFSSLFANTFIT